MNAKIILLLSILGLAACGGAAPDAAPSGSTASLQPADTELAQIYNRSCRSCHAAGGTGAPLTGDKKAWAPRVAQGLNTMLDHTFDGYKGMPPMGMCMDCNEDQFVALIEFMAATELE